MPRRTAVRIRRTEKQWAGILRRFEASGLSAREFCRREDLAVSSLQRWRSRIGRAPVAEFVELVPSSAPAAQAPSWALELSLPNGVCLRLRG
jgi:hypothetical protein